MMAFKENIHPQKHKFNGILQKFTFFFKSYSSLQQYSMELWLFSVISLTIWRSGGILNRTEKGE